MQFERTVAGVHVVNAGSVGMAYGEATANWLWVGPTAELQSTDYDIHHAAELIRATAYPQAQDFADNNILNPPTEQDALVFFGENELK